MPDTAQARKSLIIVIGSIFNSGELYIGNILNSISVSLGHRTRFISEPINFGNPVRAGIMNAFGSQLAQAEKIADEAKNSDVSTLLADGGMGALISGHTDFPGLADTWDASHQCIVEELRPELTILFNDTASFNPSYKGAAEHKQLQAKTALLLAASHGWTVIDAADRDVACREAIDILRALYLEAGRHEEIGRADKRAESAMGRMQGLREHMRRLQNDPAYRQECEAKRAKARLAVGKWALQRRNAEIAAQNQMRHIRYD